MLPVHIAAGKWLGSVFPESTWIATGNAGAIPYESGLMTIDMLGLCDRSIARRPMANMGSGIPGHEKGNGLYVLSRNPEIILFMQSRFSDHPITEREVEAVLFGISESELWDNPVFHENYTLVSERIGDSFFNYFKRQLP